MGAGDGSGLGANGAYLWVVDCECGSTWGYSSCLCSWFLVGIHECGGCASDEGAADHAVRRLDSEWVIPATCSSPHFEVIIWWLEVEFLILNSRNLT